MPPGVQALLDVGTDLSSSRRAVELAEQHPFVHAVVGIHPYEADSVGEATIAQLRALARSPRVVAIGEIGFDFFRERSSRAGQERALRLQLELALELGLPVVLHLRSSATAGAGAEDAYRACLQLLAAYGGRVRGVSHCFSGDARARRRHGRGRAARQLRRQPHLSRGRGVAAGGGARAGRTAAHRDRLPLPEPATPPRQPQRTGRTLLATAPLPGRGAGTGRWPSWAS
ncbi:MAG: hypothetical protein KatS3mg102_2173 [Planctomycetota bacterium]|nr:MAG: hypothetical protein KatS3mg102_2173 [Planctomycetota bacterium]